MSVVFQEIIRIDHLDIVALLAVGIENKQQFGSSDEDKKYSSSRESRHGTVLRVSS